MNIGNRTAVGGIIHNHIVEIYIVIIDAGVASLGQEGYVTAVLLMPVKEDGEAVPGSGAGGRAKRDGSECVDVVRIGHHTNGYVCTIITVRKVAGAQFELHLKQVKAIGEHRQGSPRPNVGAVVAVKV